MCICNTQSNTNKTIERNAAVEEIDVHTLMETKKECENYHILCGLALIQKYLLQFAV